MKRKTAAIIAAVLMAVGCTSLGVSATPYFSYNYVDEGQGITDVRVPDAYVPSRTITREEMGVELSQPQDLFRDSKGNYYIVDAKVGAVYEFDADWKLLRSVGGSAAEDRLKLRNPQGIYVTENGNMFIADTGNQRILITDAAGQYLREIRDLDSGVLSEAFVFEPKKLAVDDSGRIFVVANSAVEGIIELTTEGEFLGYVGSNKVSPNPIELLWRKIFTKKQIEKMTQFIPVEYNNLSLDDQGFIYAVTSVSNTDAPVKRLNPSGDNVLQRNASLNNNSVSGDLIVDNWYYSANRGPSNLVDVAAGDHGLYYVLDSKMGRVFTYDEDGNLLFIFGGAKTNQQGMLNIPSAIAVNGTDVLVLDRDLCLVNVYRTTDYTDLMMQAQENYRNGVYDESYTQWKQLLDRNSNFNLFYVKAGYCLYRQQDYAGAMELFRQGNARSQYSRAFVKYRVDQVHQYFAAYIIGAAVVAVVIIVLVIVLRRWKKHRTAIPKEYAEQSFWGRQIRLAWSMPFHPLAGFYDIKHEKRGSPLMATILIFLYFLSTLFVRQGRTFLFNNYYNTPMDLPYQIRMVVLPVVLFVIANWAITTLMNGKGTMKEIYMAVGYSLLPMTLLHSITTVMTTVLSLDEAAFITLIDTISVLWFALILFIGIKEVHEYSFGAAVVTVILTAFSAAVIVFICLLFFSLLQEITGFAYSIIKEIRLRM